MESESRQTDREVTRTVAGILDQQRARGDAGRTNLISVLEEIQESFGHLPRRALYALASETGESINRLYGLASFFKSFSFEPKGKHVVSVCMGTACHVRKSPEIVEEFSSQLGIEPTATTEGQGDPQADSERDSRPGCRQRPADLPRLARLSPL